MKTDGDRRRLGGDRLRPKKTDRDGRRRTETDVDGQRLTKTDGDGRRRTEMAFWLIKVMTMNIE